jgi:ribosome biogenesis GTPase
VSFPGIAALAGDCRFGDCRHLQEPDCAVREGFAPGRYQAYRNLLTEAESSASG